MGLFDFFKKKKHKSTDEKDSSKTNSKIDSLKPISDEDVRNNESEIQKNPNDIETQKLGYLELGNICLGASKRSEFSKFINDLQDYTDDEEYMTTLNYVIDCLYQKGNYFIICLDWKQEISSLSHGVGYNLTENFDLSIDLPQEDKYGERASVSFDNVFKDFDKAINENGFQLSFIDTNSDQYVVVVHKIEDIEKVESAIQKIGYDCLSSNSRKISG